MPYNRYRENKITMVSPCVFFSLVYELHMMHTALHGESEISKKREIFRYYSALKDAMMLLLDLRNDLELRSSTASSSNNIYFNDEGKAISQAMQLLNQENWKDIITKGDYQVMRNEINTWLEKAQNTIDAYPERLQWNCSKGLSQQSKTYAILNRTSTPLPNGLVVELFYMPRYCLLVPSVTPGHILNCGTVLSSAYCSVSSATPPGIPENIFFLSLFDQA